MNIGKTQENGRIILAIEGKISTTTSQQFQETLIPAFDEAQDVVLDFAKVAYIASAGLRVLFTGYETANAKGSKMILRGVSEDVMEVFEMTGFVEFLDIE
ncbi:MAG: STAS domain-containing protein [Oscillospiraceae bacterium]|nr:STAS domain-containing protein [Oscillospiraceae bacterium]